jgi:hypothetical protein
VVRKLVAPVLEPAAERTIPDLPVSGRQRFPPGTVIVAIGPIEIVDKHGWRTGSCTARR